MRPKGCALKSSATSATSRLRRSSMRSSSATTSAITRPITVSTGTTTVCAVEGFGYSCSKGLGEAQGALPDDAGDAAAAGLGQRFGHGMAGEEVADTRMVKPGAQNALQGRGNACQGIPQPVREPCGVGREAGVVTVEDAQLREQLVVAGVEPVHLTAPGAAGVGEHEGVATVGLGLARVEVGGAAHHQSGHVGNRNAPASSDREHEARERAGLVHDQCRAANRRRAVEQGLDLRLVVGDGSGEEWRTRGVKHVGEVLRLPDVEADPHVDVVGRTHCGSLRLLRPLVRKAAGALAVIHLTNQRSVACPHQRFTHRAAPVATPPRPSSDRGH